MCVNKPVNDKSTIVDEMPAQNGRPEVSIKNVVSSKRQTNMSENMSADMSITHFRKLVSNPIPMLVHVCFYL